MSSIIKAIVVALLLVMPKTTVSDIEGSNRFGEYACTKEGKWLDCFVRNEFKATGLPYLYDPYLRRMNLNNGRMYTVTMVSIFASTQVIGQPIAYVRVIFNDGWVYELSTQIVIECAKQFMESAQKQMWCIAPFIKAGKRI